MAQPPIRHRRPRSSLPMAIDERAARLIATLDLRPHPEGGRFAQIHRSTSLVQPLDERPQRAALTAIYYLLVAGELSRWHRVASDESWHHCEGAPLELLTLDAPLQTLSRLVLGPIDSHARPVRVVPGGQWQAARSLGEYTLVACTVGPGFDYADFLLLGDCANDAARAVRQHPRAAEFI
jgi:uncharacterized protein